MKKLIFTLILTAGLLSAQTHRYTDSLFIPEQTQTNAIYASAQELNSPYTGESSTHPADLNFHLFEPMSDTLSNRPLLICAHGGGFVSGNKEHDDMMEFCRIFAARGYVTATIQYRLGMNLLSAVSGERAVYRALQDSRAAVRFFKDKSGEYRIDTNSVFFLGSSAGAFMALHNLFMNEESERPAGSYQINNFPPTTDNGPDLGALDAIEPQYRHGAQPQAVISLWGALQDTVLIKTTDGGRPALLIHGTADNIVPFNVGPPFNAPSFPDTYGSFPISKRLSNIQFDMETYFVEGEGHEFYGVTNGNWSPAPNAYWDTVVTKVNNFMWTQHKPHADFHWDNFDSAVQFYDDSPGTVKWFWDFGDGASSQEQNPMHEYTADGIYNVQLLVMNNLDSWDTTSAMVEVITVAVDDVLNKPTEFALYQNYPNPFNPSTKIKYSVAEPGLVSLRVYDMLGREIAALEKGFHDAGSYSVEFNAERLPSGIYFYTLRTGAFSQARKMIYLK